MNEEKVVNLLKNELLFSDSSIDKLRKFHDELLIYNKRYNLISSSTEKDIWERHILDSAQIIKYIEFRDDYVCADLGTGAGFPGLIIGIFNQNPSFHVKLYEKSLVKCNFIENISNKLKIKATICRGSYNTHEIDANYVVCRAFKKLPEILRISREIIKNPHQLIILKGKNAQEEINKASKDYKYEYRMEKSITDKDSKIIIVKINKK